MTITSPSIMANQFLFEVVMAGDDGCLIGTSSSSSSSTSPISKDVDNGGSVLITSKLDAMLFSSALSSFFIMDVSSPPSPSFLLLSWSGFGIASSVSSFLLLVKNRWYRAIAAVNLSFNSSNCATI